MPSAGLRQLLVRMHAAALNRGEFLLGHGLHGRPGSWKAIGAEGTGEVVAAGADVRHVRPAGTPPGVVKKIYDATVAAMQQALIKAALAREGTEVSLSAPPEQFAALLVEDGKFWADLVKSAKVKAE